VDGANVVLRMAGTARVNGNILEPGGAAVVEGTVTMQYSPAEKEAMRKELEIINAQLANY